MMNTHRLCIADIADQADGSVPSRPHRSSCLMETQSTRKYIIDTIIVRIFYVPSPVPIITTMG